MANSSSKSYAQIWLAEKKIFKQVNDLLPKLI